MSEQIDQFFRPDGMNRSSLVTALVLMKDGLSADQAIALIRKQRSEYCFSNQHFVEYLQKRDSNPE